MNTKKEMWAVMKAFEWSSIQTLGLPLQCPPEGPQHFIPVFDTREQAVEWSGSCEHVSLLTVNSEKKP